MKIQSFEYTGEGMRRVYENGQWTVGISWNATMKQMNCSF